MKDIITARMNSLYSLQIGNQSLKNNMQKIVWAKMMYGWISKMGKYGATASIFLVANWVNSMERNGYILRVLASAEKL